MLICFNAYLHDCIGNSKDGISSLSKTRYSQWMQDRKDIGQTLGTYTDGPLSKFDWE